MAVFNEPTKWAQTLGKDADVVKIPDIAGDTDPSIDKIFPSVFSIPLARGGRAIPRSVLNGLFKLLGDWVYYIQNGGVSTYSENFDYVAGRVVSYNDNIYKCIQANGASSTVVTPDSNTAYWQRLDNFVRSVNGVNADAKGNTDVNKLKDINLGNFTKNQEVTTLDTTEGNCVLAGANGKSHNYDMEGTDWAFIQVHSSKPYQKFQLGTSVDNELMYRTSENDDTSWEDWSKVSLIAEQGSNYIRYHNGIQICWDSIVTTQSSETWGTLHASKEYSYKNYPKAFISKPSFAVTNSLNFSVIIGTLNGDSVKTPNITVCRPVAFSDLPLSLDYIAIGRWK